jgi:hypothetical protein
MDMPPPMPKMLMATIRLQKQLLPQPKGVRVARRPAALDAEEEDAAVAGVRRGVDTSESMAERRMEPAMNSDDGDRGVDR